MLSIPVQVQIRGNKKRKRVPKPFDQCEKSERCRRRRRVIEFAKEIGYGLSDLIPSLNPIHMLHLTTTERNKLRSIDDLHAPGERKIIQMKCDIATTHGTQTNRHMNEDGSFIVVYLTDPMT